jgi:hypothetical protein
MAHELSGQNKETQRKLMQKNRDTERGKTKRAAFCTARKTTPR